MKISKAIRSIFAKNNEINTLKNTVITDITNYPGNINDIYVYYNSGHTRISFCDGVKNFIPFISTWNTENLSTGSVTKQIKLPLTSDGVYNFVASWGDGTTSTITAYDQSEVTHTYSSGGTYNIILTGLINGWKFNNTGDILKILNVSQWGNLLVSNDGSQFAGCSNMTCTTTDMLDISNVTDLSSMFSNCSLFNSDLSNWNVSNVTNMFNMLTNTALSIINYDKLLKSWSQQTIKSNVTFGVEPTLYTSGALAARNILTSAPNNWIITDGGMNTKFISTWNTEKVGVSGTKKVKLPLVSSGIYNFVANWGDGTTSTITAYNQATVTHTYLSGGTYTIILTGLINGWKFNNTGDKLKITNISNWGNLLVGNDGSQFRGCENMTCTTTDMLDISNVTDLSSMFSNCSLFNSDLSNWNVSNVTNMFNMFYNCYKFNQDLSNWNVSNVTSMNNMFYNCYKFNQDLSNWNVSNVTSMNYMLVNCYEFNQDLSTWNVSNVTSMINMLVNTLVTITNYNKILNSWSLLTVKPNVSLGVSSPYTLDVLAARNVLTSSPNSWIITDGGMITTIQSFSSNWNTEKLSTESSATKQVKLPLTSDGVYNFVANWGDGTTSTVTAYDQAEVTHTYLSGGTYTIILDGTINGWKFNNTGDKLKITNISNWGNLLVSNDGNQFYGCQNMTCTATDTLDVSNVTDMTGMFNNCQIFNGYINNWNVSNVTTMIIMFSGCWKFDRNLNLWDVSNVTNMSQMFFACYVFTSDLSSWNVSNVTDMIQIVSYCTVFNSDLSSWNVSNVINMSSMFQECSIFNQDLSSWDVSNVTNMGEMFVNCNIFTSDLSSWNVSNVINMSNMFSNCSVFNSDLSKWNVSGVHDMNGMFSNCSVFNSDLSSWDVSNVYNMNGMFSNCSVFNSNLSNWDVSNVNDMLKMFDSCFKFNQDLSNWDVSNIYDMTDILTNTSLSTVNYDKLLNAWSLLTVQPSVYLGVSSTKYSSAALEARNILISDPNYWEITDGGMI